MVITTLPEEHTLLLSRLHPHNLVIRSDFYVLRLGAWSLVQFGVARRSRSSNSTWISAWRSHAASIRCGEPDPRENPMEHPTETPCPTPQRS